MTKVTTNTQTYENYVAKAMTGANGGYIKTKYI